MGFDPWAWIGRRQRQRAARQWQRLGGDIIAGRKPLSRRLRDEALALRQTLSLLLQAGDRAVTRTGGSLRALPLPAGTDWRWRPMIFCGPMQPAGMTAPANGQRLGPEIALWHDCPHRALILRQQVNQRATDLAPHGLRLEVMGFAGSYLSLSLDLPDAAREGLGRHSILRLAADFHAEHPLTAYGRLNISQGPNTETILRQLGDPITDRDGGRVTEFDLGYAQLAPRPVDRLWLDLIFEAPRMNAVTLSDMVMSRHTRAEL